MIFIFVEELSSTATDLNILLFSSMINEAVELTKHDFSIWVMVECFWLGGSVWVGLFDTSFGKDYSLLNSL